MIFFGARVREYAMKKPLRGAPQATVFLTITQANSSITGVLNDDMPTDFYAQ
jgi:hypothetical protein